MQKHKMYQYQGRKIHYRDEGQNNRHTVVLLHGWAQDLDIWSGYTLGLMHELRVVSIDLPGHGMSDTYSEMHSMDFMANCVHELLNEIGIDQCVMIGHSLGGYVALAFARMYGAQLIGLGLINSHALPDTKQDTLRRQNTCNELANNYHGYISTFITSLFAEKNRRAFERIISNIIDHDYDRNAQDMIASQKGMMRRNSEVNTLAQFERPIMFIYGKQDNRIPIEVAIVQTSLPKHAESLILDQVGHMAHIEAEKEVTNFMKHFVETCYLK
ncbi:MAG: alpha/beta hydrolase [Bacteroidales bacterium]|nr:alpha/beta hydrolase [Candidatus Colimorpha onthohippi]